MKMTKWFWTGALLAGAACSSQKPEPADPKKCLAGEVWSDLEGKCVPSGCTKDIHCDDGNPCNGEELCVGGKCQRVPGVIVERCDDRVACTLDYCDQSSDTCAHLPDNLRCLAWEKCDPLGGCLPRPCNSDVDCSDGRYCSGKEKCVGGFCTPGLPPDCGDTIDCTLDFCSEESSACQHRPDHTLCTTGKICDPAQGGCVIKPCATTDECQDGSFCNGTEKCVELLCLPGVRVECNDQIACTQDHCDDQNQTCVFTPDDDLCDNGIFCDGEGTCVANQGCLIAVVPECADSIDCTQDSCNTALDACQHQPDDGWCQPWEVCDPILGCQLRASCETDQQCPPGKVCVAGQCVLCETGTSRSCDTGQLGACREGLEQCLGGQWGACEPVNDPAPEICDLVDNDCDGMVDGEQACACLTACAGADICPVGGEACSSYPGWFSACLSRCDAGNGCPLSTAGASRVCVAIAELGGSVCVCEPSCPQPCFQSEECRPYGLSACSNSICTATCNGDTECPAPYVCKLGQCICDKVNIGTSCLSCESQEQCVPQTACSYRPGGGSRYKECGYDCMRTEECPLRADFQSLYCHLLVGMGGSRCACAPPTECFDCANAPANACEPYWMDCLAWNLPSGIKSMCTAPCELDGHCPAGWFCYYDGQSTQGFCVEKGCYCQDIPCNPMADICHTYSPELKCLLVNLIGPDTWLCSKPCYTHGECPPGTYCQLDPQGGLSGWCLCRAL